MRTFLIRSLLFFVISAVLAVALFFFVNSQLKSGSLPSEEVVNDVVSEVTSGTKEKTEGSVEAVVSKVPEEGIALSSLPLTESQKKALIPSPINPSIIHLSLIK